MNYTEPVPSFHAIDNFDGKYVLIITNKIVWYFILNNSVIFLDINGVLISSTMHLATLGRLNDIYSPIAVGLLNNLCQTTNARIVVSSSWRLYGRKVVYNNLFKSIAMLNWMLTSKHKPIPIHIKFFDEEPNKNESWCTPFRMDILRSRGEEIDAWLDTWGHLIDNYCILDDTRNVLPHQKDHFVCIERNESGFDVDYYEQALGILQQPNNPQQLKLNP